MIAVAPPQTKRRFVLVTLGLGVVLFLFALWTWQQNQLWSNEVAFLDDQVKKAAQKARPYCNLAAALNAYRAYDDALRVARQGAAIEPKGEGCWIGVALASYHLGLKAEALDAARRAVEIEPGCEECRQIIENLAKKVD